MSVNSKQVDINEINWMLIKQSVEFIRCDNRDSCDCSRRSGILGSSLEKNISLIEENTIEPPMTVTSVQLLFIQEDSPYIESCLNLFTTA